MLSNIVIGALARFHILAKQIPTEISDLPKEKIVFLLLHDCTSDIYHGQ